MIVNLIHMHLYSKTTKLRVYVHFEGYSLSWEVIFLRLDRA